MEREHPEARIGLARAGSSRSTRRQAQIAAALGEDTPTPASSPAPPVRPKAETVRLTANLPQDAAEALDKTAAATGFNKLTTIVRAIRVFADLVEADARGAQVVLKEADGSASRLILR